MRKCGAKITERTPVVKCGKGDKAVRCYSWGLHKLNGYSKCTKDLESEGEGKGKREKRKEG
jgi:hypothetical protein